MGLGATDQRTLYRAVLSPIGWIPALGDTDDHTPPRSDEDHTGTTFFSSVTGYEATVPAGNYGDSLGTPDRIRWKALPLATNVLHWEVRLWTQYTTTWDRVDSSGALIDFVRWPQPSVPEVCPPAWTWDSDRLDGHNSPPFVMDWNNTINNDFPLPPADSDGDGYDDAEDPDYITGNVFPRAVMAVVVVDPQERVGGQLGLRLSSNVSAGDTTIPVQGSIPSYNKSWPFLLIEDDANGEEWVRFTRFDAANNRFVLDAGDAQATRGARGTTDVDHGSGCTVKLGQTFSRVFFNPTGREYWEH